jgi:hypothetical protein
VSSDVQRFLTFVIGVLDLVGLILLLRRPSRKFLLLVIYLAVDLISVPLLTLIDMIYQGSAAAAKPSPGQVLYGHFYWTFEVVQDLLLFLLVISFTYRATEGSPVRGAARNMLIGVVMIASALPFLLFHPIVGDYAPWPTGAWFSSTAQLLNFGAALMNLALWTALIGTKHRDPQDLTVSTGLGVMVTGAALSYGFRHFLPLGFWIPGVLLLLTHMLAVMAWCWAFWRGPKPRSGSRNVLSSALAKGPSAMLI